MRRKAPHPSLRGSIVRQKDLLSPVIAQDRRPSAGRPVPRRRLAALGLRLRREGKRVVFTNGCFDLLHPGHVALLKQARRLGDVLVVGLNSDRSVRRLKGPGRPILKAADRATVLAALRSVDYVTIFPEPTPAQAIRLLTPDVLVKGADWGAGEIVGRDVVEARGGRVVRLALKRGHSTTRVIARIVSAAGGARPRRRSAPARLPSPRRGP
jgi:rfaE bifunctional protein nucleotidyltransferase chain/domain